MSYPGFVRREELTRDEQVQPLRAARLPQVRPCRGQGELLATSHRGSRVSSRGLHEHVYSGGRAVTFNGLCKEQNGCVSLPSIARWS